MKNVKVIYGDCLELLKDMDGGSIDLCLTDPPYDVDVGKLKDDYKRFFSGIGGGEKFVNKEYYEDKIDNYPEFSIKWFKEVTRVCRRLIFTPGNGNLEMWLDIEKPREILIHYKSNCSSITHHVRFNRYEFILCYGKFGPFEFYENVFDIPLNNTFIQKHKFIHPAIKEVNLWRAIVERIKPDSLLDPFLGSGTTLQVALENGIPFIGIEKRKEYDVDIQKRIKLGKREYDRRYKNVRIGDLNG